MLWVTRFDQKNQAYLYGFTETVIPPEDVTPTSSSVILTTPVYTAIPNVLDQTPIPPIINPGINFGAILSGTISQPPGLLNIQLNRGGDSKLLNFAIPSKDFLISFLDEGQVDSMNVNLLTGSTIRQVFNIAIATSIASLKKDLGNGGSLTPVDIANAIIAALKQNYIDNPTTGDNVTRVVGPLP